MSLSPFVRPSICPSVRPSVRGCVKWNFVKVWRLKFNVWSFVAISSRSDNATQVHRSCQGLLGLFYYNRFFYYNQDFDFFIKEGFRRWIVTWKWFKYVQKVIQKAVCSLKNQFFGLWGQTKHITFEDWKSKPITNYP